MPNCFTLTHVGFPEPATLESVDRAICQAFDHPYSSRCYAFAWYDCVGFLLACGKTFAEIAEAFADDHEIRAICHFLAENYIPNAWVEIGK